jgi:hypothetical protein
MRDVLGAFTGRLFWSLVLIHAVGCGPLSPQEGNSGEAAGPITQEGSLHTSLGLSVNGLTVNGLNVNGLTVNGLNVTGLESAAFQEWFNEEPSIRELTMHYLVLCAVPSGQTRTFTNPVTGTLHAWNGELGLAPDWAAGALPTVAEQQLVSACLAAHVNAYGQHVTLSVQGRTAKGEPIASTPEELAAYTEEEACFFGNLFTDEGSFAAAGRTQLKSWESTLRTCGLAPRDYSPSCAPITHVGSCQKACTWDKAVGAYTQCSYNGVSYPALTTRLQRADIYTCGDGVCQASESCGSGRTYNSCAADCGTCA